MNDRIPCSVIILTYNSGATLDRALSSVERFDDLVICDGGSTDDTRALAMKYSARVIAQGVEHRHPDGRIANFSSIRNDATKAARYDWVLHLDSDEYLSPEAVEEIETIVRAPLAKNSPRAYRLPRITVVKGICIDCATVYPNYQLRFFHREGVEGFKKPVHERILVKEGARVGTLKHPEFVPLEEDEATFKVKQLRYLKIEAERHANDTFWQWVTGPVFGALRSSLSYLLRHLRILLFCRGTYMPLWVEMSHHWYNWQLISLTAQARRKRKKR